MLPKFLFVNSDHTTQAYTEQLLGSHSWGEDSVESVRGQSAETINSKISALLRVIWGYKNYMLFYGRDKEEVLMCESGIM